MSAPPSTQSTTRGEDVDVARGYAGADAKEPERAVADDEVKHVHVGCLTRTVVRHPCLVMWALFALILGFTIVVAIVEIAPAQSVFEVLGFPSFSPKFEPVVLRGLGYGEVIEDGYDANADDRRGRRLQDDEDDDDEEEREFTLAGISLWYEDLAGDNLLTRENVLKMIDVENAILDNDWEKVCKLQYDENDKDSRCAQPLTILNYLHQNDKEHKELCKKGFCLVSKTVQDSCDGSFDSNGTTVSTGLSWGKYPCVSTAFDWRQGKLAPEEDWDKLLEDLLCDPGFNTKFLLDKNAEACEKPITTKFARARYDVGCPLKGYKTCSDRRAQQNGDLEGGFFFGRGDYGNNLLASLRTAVDEHSATPTDAYVTSTNPTGGRTINVFFESSLTGRQIDLGIITALFSLISLVLVFIYIWVNVGSLFLAVTGVFEILMSLPLAWFIWRVVLWQQLLDFFSVFLLPFLIICIGADDIFVFMDTWKASGAKEAAISGSVETRLAWTYRQAAAAMFTTTATTVLALVMTATSSIPFISSFGVIAALVVLMDYVLVISWFPTTVIVYHTYIERAYCCRTWLACCGPCKVEPAQAEGAAAQPAEERKSVRWLRQTVAPLLFRQRYAMLGIAGLAVVGMAIAFGLLYEEAQDFPSFYVDSHPRNRVETITDNEFFVSDDWKHQVTVIYGLDPDMPVTRAATGQLVPDLFEEENITTNYYKFDFTPAMQEALVEDCTETRTNSSLVDSRESYCILRDLRDWAGPAFPYKTERQLFDALEAFVDSSTYSDITANFSNYRRLTHFVPQGASGVKAIWFSYNATIPQEITSGPDTLGPWQELWYGHVNATCAAPCYAHMNNPPVPEPINWEFMTIIAISVREVWSTMGLSLLCAFVVLMLTTFNYIVSIFVVFNITCTMVCVVGSVFAVGNNLSIFECTLIALTIGLAIDYAVHIAHFYVHSKGKTRFDRTQEALAEIGISVIGGAGTTVFAGLPLFAAPERFTSLFGFFIFFTAMWALFLTTFLLVPLLMIVGPEGGQGDISRFLPSAARSSARLSPRPSNRVA